MSRRYEPQPQEMLVSIQLQPAAVEQIAVQWMEPMSQVPATMTGLLRADQVETLTENIAIRVRDEVLETLEHRLASLGSQPCKL